MALTCRISERGVVPDSTLTLLLFNKFTQSWSHLWRRMVQSLLGPKAARSLISCIPLGTLPLPAQAP